MLDYFTKWHKSTSNGCPTTYNSMCVTCTYLYENKFVLCSPAINCKMLVIHGSRRFGDSIRKTEKQIYRES